MKSSFSKRAVAVVLSVMMVFSMITMMEFCSCSELTDGSLKLITTEY